MRDKSPTSTPPSSDKQITRKDETICTSQSGTIAPKSNIKPHPPKPPALVTSSSRSNSTSRVTQRASNNHVIPEVESKGESNLNPTHSLDGGKDKTKGKSKPLSALRKVVVKDKPSAVGLDQDAGKRIVPTGPSDKVKVETSDKAEGSARKNLEDLIETFRKNPHGPIGCPSSLNSANVKKATAEHPVTSASSEHPKDKASKAEEPFSAQQEDRHSRSPTPETVPATPPRSQASVKSLPLPIGAERELGLIPTSPQSPAITTPNRWSQDMSIWSYPPGIASVPHQYLSKSLSPPRRDSQRLWGGPDDSLSAYARRPDQERNALARQLQDRQYEEWNTTSSAFDPFGSHTNHDSMPRANSRAVPIIDPNSSEGRRRQASSASATASVQDFGFSELVISPGFGGSRALLNQRRQSVQEHDGGNDVRSDAYSRLEDRRGIDHHGSSQAEWYHSYGSQTYRRSSAPSAASRGQALTPLTPSRGIGHNHSSLNSVRYDEHGAYGIHASSSGSRFGTPASERRNTASLALPISGRPSVQVAHYNSTGVLPATWPRADSHFPSGPAPFAPGDWICPMPLCEYHNFNRNADCRACGHTRPMEPSTHQALAVSPPLGSVGDWRCECGFINERIGQNSGRFQDFNSSPSEVAAYRPRRIPAFLLQSQETRASLDSSYAQVAGIDRRNGYEHHLPHAEHGSGQTTPTRSTSQQQADWARSRY